MKPNIEPGEFVPILPWEIQIEILLRLPVKTLMQFRCVCKSWKSLISNDKLFEKLHLHRSAKNKHVLVTLGRPCYEAENDHYLIPCPVRRLVEDPSSMIDEDGCCNLKGKYFVLGSCNGLVCFLYNWDWSYGSFFPGRFRFWNPATRLWSKKSPNLTMDERMRFGFGYDDSRDTYKVVGILDSQWSSEEWKWETVVYSMGDSCWRKISSKPNFRLLLMGNTSGQFAGNNSGQFAGGCLNWLAFDKLNGRNPHVEQLALVIVSFDMRKEAYRSLSLPEGEGTGDYKTKLSVSGNCLCLLQDRKKTHLDVWQMREYGVRESWTRLVSVSYEHLQCVNYMLCLSQPLMCLGEDGEILMLFKKNHWVVIMYNLRDNSVKYVQHPANKRWLPCYGYVQSLVSPY